MPRKYPPEFVDRVAAKFPDLQQLAESGSAMLGKFLADLRETSIRGEKILEMLDSGDVAGLRALAVDEVERQQLFSDWYDLNKH